MADIPPCPMIRKSSGNLTLSPPTGHKFYMQHILHDWRVSFWIGTGNPTTDIHKNDGFSNSTNHSGESNPNYTQHNNTCIDTSTVDNESSDFLDRAPVADSSNLVDDDCQTSSNQGIVRYNDGPEGGYRYICPFPECVSQEFGRVQAWKRHMQSKHEAKTIERPDLECK
jgi:hypothetical protein